MVPHFGASHLRSEFSHRVFLCPAGGPGGRNMSEHPLTNRAGANLSTQRRIVNMNSHSQVVTHQTLGAVSFRSDGVRFLWGTLLAKNFTSSYYLRRMTDRGAGRPGAFSGAEFAGIGLQFAVTLLAFVFVGVWLDRRLGTTWLFTVLGTFVGAGGAFFSMYRRVIAAQPRERRDRQSGPENSGGGAGK